MSAILYIFFFFNDTATTEIYTLSLHDALPISRHVIRQSGNPSGGRLTAATRRPLHDRLCRLGGGPWDAGRTLSCGDRKSTRLNSSHANISYAVFCLKKKNTQYMIFPLSLNLST